MATADAKEVSDKFGGVRVAFGDGKKRYWSEVFERNPLIPYDIEKGEQFAWVANYPMRRPYVKETTEERYIFKEDFKVKKGFLYPSNPRPKGEYILIEPNVKTDLMIGINKDWGFYNWQIVADKLDLPWYQMGREPLLDKNRHIETPTLNDAINVLAGAKLLVTTDGALHHAAAALGIPAVVIWGGLASPTNLGYDEHINLWHGDEPCGTHSSFCKHCKQALAKVKPDEVIEAIKGAYARH